MTLLDEFKEYIRVDGNDEDLTLNTFLTSAKEALKFAGVNFPASIIAVNESGEKTYPLHFLAVIVLAAHYYENRQAVSDKNLTIVPFSVQHMILQLKLVKIDESV